VNFKGVLFDMDGVLIKSMEQHLEAWQHAFRRFKATVKKEDFYQLEGRGVKSVVETLVDKYQIDEKYKQTIMAEKIAYYNHIFAPVFYDGLFDLLTRLKESGKRMAVVTGGQRERVSEIVKTYFNGYFSAMITSDDVQFTKPYPEPYLKGAAALGLSPQACVVIENAPMGIKSGKEAGIRVIAITTTLDKKHLQEADWIVNNFNQVEACLFAREEIVS
jgi:beta-phosphoglucomutase